MDSPQYLIFNNFLIYTDFCSVQQSGIKTQCQGANAGSARGVLLFNKSAARLCRRQK